MREIRGPVHLVGIGGMHMSAIGQLLLERGVAVTGSDMRLSPMTAKLQALGARVFEGHVSGNVGDAALVVTTAAAADENPELVEARRRDIPVILRAEMVARLMEGKRVIAVAGAHGKTTTSSLIAFILLEAGRSPMYLLGGESIDLGGHAAWGEGDLCVVEADEYKRAFHEYTPEFAVITNVEADHLDYYGTEEAYIEAFVEFGKKVEGGGLLLACTDDAGARFVSDALGDEPIRHESYGLNGPRYWSAKDVELSERGATFMVTRGGTAIGKLRAGVGQHFVLNALAATAVCLHLDVPFPTVAAAVGSFRGARRRFERIGEAGGVLVMDDYAHHPTEVRTTIAAARNKFPERRLIGVYQPHTYSRISYLWADWTRCWAGLDALVVLETYAAREAPVAGRSAAADLAAAIVGPKAQYARDFDDAAAKAVALAKPGDVVFTIGAGDVNEVGPRMLELLR